VHKHSQYWGSIARIASHADLFAASFLLFAGPPEWFEVNVGCWENYFVMAAATVEI